MPSSFTAQVATKLIVENPGRTAQQIVRDALDRGIISSRGRNRIAGQVGALAKMYNDGRLLEVRRDEQQRPYRYYPKGSVTVHPPSKPVAEPVTFRPTLVQEEVLTALTETRRFSSRSEAVVWLIDEGIAAKQSYVDRITQTYREIERLRRQVKQVP